MTVVLPDEATWLEARRQGISSSDAAAILGVSPWSTPLQVYANKLGLMPAPEETEQMRWGKILEPLVAARYIEETQRELRDYGRYTLQRSRIHPILVATLDREIVAGPTPIPASGILEIKTTGFTRADDWLEEPPVHVQVQIQHQLAVMDAAWGSVAVLIGGQRFLWCDIERNERFIALLIERCEAFWAQVQRLDPPAPGRDDRQTLMHLYPADTGTSVQLPPESLEWDRRLDEAKDQIKTWEGVKEEAEARLKGAIGSATYGVLPAGAGRYSWKTSERHEAPREARVLNVRSLRRLAQ